MNQSASSAIGVNMKISETPAIVTVITREEMESRGYRTLAEALRTVPGFYDVDDGVTHNFGVRGVNGGLYASGSVIKLMIDGQPVDYGPSTGNFFDQELIPMQVIERVEIVRGPASALYGANAFLGVINVITRDGSGLNGVHLRGTVGLTNGNPGGGGGIIAGAAGEKIDAVLAASYDRYDHSGLALPRSGPTYEPGLGLTRNDVTQPASAFGKVTLDDFAAGKLSLMASLQRLDAAAPFFYLHPVNRDSRYALLNQTYRAKYTADLSDRISLAASATYFTGTPTSAAQFDVGLGHPGIPAGNLLLPREAVEGGAGNAEVRAKWSHLTLTGGVDYLYENHLTESFAQELTLDQSIVKAGTIIPGLGAGAYKTFQNFGAYAQAVVTTTVGVSAIAGVRVDDHTIYGVNPTARLGIVYAPTGSLSLKALYGSSFKAPSAEQLFGQPVAFNGGTQGNPHLQAQTANNFDVDAELRLPRDLGDVQINGYLTNVQGLVEYDLSGPFYIASNDVSEWIAGGELSTHLVFRKDLRFTLNAGLAQNVAQASNSGVSTASQVRDPLYPTGQVHLIGEYTLPWWALHVGAEVSGISSRPTSSNNAQLGSLAYDTPPYVYTALFVSTSGRQLFPNRDSYFCLRLTNVLNQTWVEPGFGGTDIPSQGLAATLTWIQTL